MDWKKIVFISVIALLLIGITAFFFRDQIHELTHATPYSLQEELQDTGEKQSQETPFAL